MMFYQDKTAKWRSQREDSGKEGAKTINRVWSRLLHNVRFERASKNRKKTRHSEGEKVRKMNWGDGVENIEKKKKVEGAEEVSVLNFDWGISKQSPEEKMESPWLISALGK